MSTIISIDYPPDPTNPFQALIDYLTKTVTPFSMLVMLGVYLSYLLEYVENK